jgi:peptidoglycan biosynthesis protein MviN/MurJ (putative lipid II flippase)
MRLKIATTAFVILGLLTLLSYPWLVGSVPRGGSKQALAEYATRLGFYIIAALLIWFITAVLAVLTAHRARDRYRAEAMENFQHLIEETMKDHGKREA